MESLNEVQEVTSSENELKHKFLTFGIGKENYAIPIQYVTEIIGIQSITDLPDVPEYVKGVINLRGRVIPLIDVRLRFGMDEKEYDDRTCIIVTLINDIPVGLIIDTVKEVIDIPEQQIDPPPKVKKGQESRFIHGLGKTENSVIIILDMEKFLFEEEIGLLDEIAG